MAVYQVRLVNSAIALDRTISVPDDQYILDIAEEAGIRLPEAGYTITCVAYPMSDCTLQTHQEQVLYQSSLYFPK